MAKLPNSFVKSNDDLFVRKQVMRLGGVVPLRTFWAITKPGLAKRIYYTKTAEVKAKEDTDGNPYLYINLPLSGGGYEELRVGICDLEEGDIVDVNSIVVQFIDDGNGGAYLRYSAVYVEDEKQLLDSKDIKQFIKGNCGELLDSMKDIVKWSKKKKIHFNSEYHQNSYDCYEDTTDRDIWDAMTDGQMEYPDEGYDDDYEFMGK